MAEREDTAPETEVPEYLSDAAEPEAGGAAAGGATAEPEGGWAAVPRTGVAALRAHDRLLDRRRATPRLGDRLPQRRLLPARRRRARRRRPAPRLLGADHLLVPQAGTCAPAPRRPRRRSTAPSERTGSPPLTALAARSPRRSCGRAPPRCSATGSPEAYADDARRGWGIAFGERRRARRRTTRRAGCGSRAWATLTPESAPARRADLAHLPAGWDAVGRGRHRGADARPRPGPTTRSEIGRFTPLRRGGLDGQTFEIEVAAGTDAGRPMFTRGYVTITALVTPDDPAALRDVVRRARGRARALRRGRAAGGAGGRRAAGRLRPHHARGPLHGRRPQPAAALRRTTARRGCAPPGPGTRCRGTSSRPTGSPDARPSTPSGARATSARRACCTSSRCASRPGPGRVSERGRHRRRAQRARRRDPARRGRACR